MKKPIRRLPPTVARAARDLARAGHVSLRAVREQAQFQLGELRQSPDVVVLSMEQSIGALRRRNDRAYLRPSRRARRIGHARCQLDGAYEATRRHMWAGVPQPIGRAMKAHRAYKKVLQEELERLARMMNDLDPPG